MKQLYSPVVSNISADPKIRTGEGANFNDNSTFRKKGAEIYNAGYNNLTSLCHITHGISGKLLQCTLIKKEIVHSIERLLNAHWKKMNI